MRRRSVIVLFAALIVLGVMPPALAKGPTGATIEGEGVAGTITIDQPGELGQGTAMSRLVEHIGFFELVFGDSPKASSEAPTAAIGKSRLTISWHMDGSDDVIVQHLYPYADGGPVTHVEPGQTFWDGHQTAGGWFQVTGDIAGPLTEFGVDEDVFAGVVKSSAAVAAPATDKSGTASVKSATETVTDKGVTDKGTTDEGAATKAQGATADAASGSVEPAPPVGSTAGFPTGVVITALLAAAAIMGGTAWIRQRRPMPR